MHSDIALNFTPNVLHEVIAQYVAEAKEYVLPRESWKKSLDKSQLGSTVHGNKIPLKYPNNPTVVTNNNHFHLTERGTT